MNTITIHNRITELVGKRNLIADELASCIEQRESNVHQAGVLERSRLVIQNAAQLTQKQLEYRVGELVSLAMAHVFPDPYELVLQFECKRGRTEAAIMFKDAQGNLLEPMEASGGGTWDIAALALRIALWSLKKVRNRPIMVLDEPFKFLHGKEVQERAASMVKDLSKRLGIQFIIVTQEEWGLGDADRIFRVSRTKPAPSVVTVEG